MQTKEKRPKLPKKSKNTPKPVTEKAEAVKEEVDWNKPVMSDETPIKVKFSSLIGKLQPYNVKSRVGKFVDGFEQKVIKYEHDSLLEQIPGVKDHLWLSEEQRQIE